MKMEITEVTEKNLVDQIINHEGSETETIADLLGLYSYLIKTGQCWRLQGHYGRTAKSLIKEGFISEEGVVDTDLVEERLYSG